jgi:hypothetical protein
MIDDSGGGPKLQVWGVAKRIDRFAGDGYADSRDRICNERIAKLTRRNIPKG